MADAHPSDGQPGKGFVVVWWSPRHERVGRSRDVYESLDRATARAVHLNQHSGGFVCYGGASLEIAMRWLDCVHMSGAYRKAGALYHRAAGRLA
jgi:hypothetical protein